MSDHQGYPVEIVDYDEEYGAGPPPRGFGRGWIPAGRNIGLPGDELGASERESLPYPPVAPAQAGAYPTARPDAALGSAADGSVGPLPSQGRRTMDDAALPPAHSAMHNGWTPERKVRFLDALAGHGNVRAACAEVGVSHEAAYRLRRRDAVFAEGWAAALVLARAHVEQVLGDRALNGVEEQVFYRGELVGVRVRHDARLLLAHMARLDRLAEDTLPAARAARFDEMLALVAGESFPEKMADAPDGFLYEADPLLPIERERWLMREGARACNRAHEETLDLLAERAEAEDRDPERFEAYDPMRRLEPEELDLLAEAEIAATRRGREAAAAAWDAWRSRARAIAEGAGEAAEAPVEFKSLDRVNRVNFEDGFPVRLPVRPERSRGMRFERSREPAASSASAPLGMVPRLRSGGTECFDTARLDRIRTSGMPQPGSPAR